MKNEFDTIAYIDKYLDGLLSEEEVDEFEIRCLEDKAFFQKVRQRELLREQVDSVIKEMEGDESFSESIEKAASRKKSREGLSAYWPPHIKRSWKYTFILTAGAIIVAIWLLNPTGDPFRELPHLEYLVSNHESRSTAVEVLSPQNGVKITGPIKFVWKLGKEPHYLKILNNQENELAEILIDKDEYLFEKKLFPGLYYWKLDRDHELLYVGKFIVPLQ